MMASMTLDIKIKTTLFSHIVLWIAKKIKRGPIKAWIVVYMMGCFIKIPGRKWSPILWRPKAKRGLWEIIDTENGPLEVPR